MPISQIHKFDPVPITDYLAFAGFLTRTETADRIPVTKNYIYNVIADPLTDPDGSGLGDYENTDLAYRDERKRPFKLKLSGTVTSIEIRALRERVAHLRRILLPLVALQANQKETGNCVLLGFGHLY